MKAIRRLYAAGFTLALLSSVAFGSNETAISFEADSVLVSTQLAGGKPVAVEAHSEELTAYLDLHIDGTIIRISSGAPLPILDLNEATFESGISIMPEGKSVIEPIVVQTQRPFNGEGHLKVVATGATGRKAVRQAVQQRLNEVNPGLAQEIHSTMSVLSDPQILASLPPMQKSLVEGFNSIESSGCGKQKGTTAGTRSIGGFACSGACGGTIGCAVVAAGGVPLTGGASAAAAIGACSSFAGGCGFCLGSFIDWLINMQ